MRLEAKAFQISLVFHALLLVLFVILGKDTLNAQNVVVIDLTLIDHVTAGAGSSINKKPEDQKSASKKAPTIIEQKREEVRKEKKETQVKIAKEDKKIPEEEQVPPVETIPIKKENEQNSLSEDPGKEDNPGTFLAHATGVSSPAEGENAGTERTQDFGNGAGNVDGVMKGYLRSNLAYIKEMIQKNIAYPNIARRNGWTGKVTVSFIIAHDGRVRDIEITRSSGFECLDKNAVRAVERSSPFPHPPLEARIIIPILYELH